MVHGYKTQCFGKKAYPKHANAGYALSWLRKRLEDAKNQEPYLCAWCEQWHLGHKSNNPELEEQRKAERLAAIKDDGWRMYR